MIDFLYQEALKMRGFDETIKLAYSGENGEFFFKNLKKILDIDEVNFHKTIINIINK